MVYINTFSIGFENEGFNEAQHAKSVANFLGTNHEELYLSNNEIIDSAKHMSSIFDEPFYDPSQIPTYLVSKLAKSKVTVSLSGDGGDEIFYGYSKYILAYQLSKVPFRNILSTTIGGLASLLQIFKIKSNLLKKVDFLNLLLSSRDYIEMSEYLSNDRFADKYKSSSNVSSDISYPLASNDIINSDVMQAMMYLDRKGYLTENILTKVDRASMAVSLENRAPLLDHRIIELSSSFPNSFLMDNGIQKYILKDILYRYVPKKLVDRPKTGFTPPLSEWIRGDLKKWTEELIYESNIGNEFLRLDYAKELYEDHLNNKFDNSLPIWKILMFIDWYKRWT